MPINWNQVERDEDSIDRDHEEGLISSAEAARYRRELHADVEEAEREEADHRRWDYEGRA